MNRGGRFALPGPIGGPGSEHWLIKTGATLVTTPEDILENLQYGLHWLPTTAENSLYSLNQDEAALPFLRLWLTWGDEVTPVDVVAERAGNTVPAVVAQLLGTGVSRMDRSCTQAAICPIKETKPCSTY